MRSGHGWRNRFEISRKARSTKCKTNSNAECSKSSNTEYPEYLRRGTSTRVRSRVGLQGRDKIAQGAALGIASEMGFSSNLTRGAALCGGLALLASPSGEA